MNIVVKNGNASLTKGTGFSFDNWVKHKLMEDFNLISNGPCCDNKQLKFKNGLTTHILYGDTDNRFFNLEKWLRDTILSFNIVGFDIDDYEALCCPTKKALAINKGFITISNQNTTELLDLKRRLKQILDLYEIEYTDPCCV